MPINLICPSNLPWHIVNNIVNNGSATNGKSFYLDNWKISLVIIFWEKNELNVSIHKITRKVLSANLLQLYQLGKPIFFLANKRLQRWNFFLQPSKGVNTQCLISKVLNCKKVRCNSSDKIVLQVEELSFNDPLIMPICRTNRPLNNLWNIIKLILMNIIGAKFKIKKASIKLLRIRNLYRLDSPRIFDLTAPSLD